MLLEYLRFYIMFFLLSYLTIGLCGKEVLWNCLGRRVLISFEINCTSSEFFFALANSAKAINLCNKEC